MATNRKQSASTPALLTNALVTLYTVPSNTTAKDITFDFQNTDTAAIGVTVHLVPSGGSASDTNKLFSETSPNGMIIAASEWRSVPIDQAISAGASIQSKASTTGKVACHITVTEVS
jgi:CO dehydrogenase/acetyl-CoA synthase gamma subunit (corrinoid Fe-S protein)